MARKDGKPGRLAQIRQTYQMTKSSIPGSAGSCSDGLLLPLAIARASVSLLAEQLVAGTPRFHLTDR